MKIVYQMEIEDNSIHLKYLGKEMHEGVLYWQPQHVWIFRTTRSVLPPRAE